jgi:hypothetical protein
MRRDGRGVLIDRSATHTQFLPEKLRALRKHLRRQQDNIKLEIAWDDVDRIVWLTIGTSEMMSLTRV